MAVSSWMLRCNRIKNTRFFKNRASETVEDIACLDYSLGPCKLMHEVLTNICQKIGVSKAKKLHYLRSFVELLAKYAPIKFPETFGYTVEDILCCLRVSLIQDCLHIRAAGLRAVRYLIQTEEDVICLNNLHYPYLMARGVDLVLKSGNEVLMDERIQSLRLMRHILSIAPQHFDAGLVRCLVSVVLRPLEETDRLLRACLAILCELSVLNADLLVKCDGAKALLFNLTIVQKFSLAEAVCASLLYLLNDPSTRNIAEIDLRCMATIYTNLMLPQRSNCKNSEEWFLRMHDTMICLLRSWIGVIHFCNPIGDVFASGLKSIVQCLYLNQHLTRKAILDLIYELILVTKPEWTDNQSVSLNSVNPSRIRYSFQLNENFVVDEGMSLLPYISSENCVNLIDSYLSLVLICLVHAGLPDALVEVIVSGDGYFSTYATILLGEFLHLARTLLPEDCYDGSPMPNLISYAMGGYPQSCAPLPREDFTVTASYSGPPTGPSSTRKQKAVVAVSTLTNLHKMLQKETKPASLFLENIARHGQRKQKMKPKLSKTMSPKECDILIRDTGVISSDVSRWNWGSIRIALKYGDEEAIKSHDFGAFIKRLLHYYKTSSREFSMVPISPKLHGRANVRTTVACDFLDFLVESDYGEGAKYLDEFLHDFDCQLRNIVMVESPKDCFLSPSQLTSTLSQDYFLLVGRLTNTENGLMSVKRTKILDRFEHLIATSRGDCYSKLIVSNLSYTWSATTRKIMERALACGNAATRLYAAKFLHVLLRANATGSKDYSRWLLEMMVNLVLSDGENDGVSTAALAALHEAANYKVYLEEIVDMHPSLMHLGEEGLYLLIRFVSLESGFNLLKSTTFLTYQLHHWGTEFNVKYALSAEIMLHEAFTQYQRGDSGKFRRRSAERKGLPRQLHLPPHLYGQLAQHEQGLDMLSKDEHAQKAVITVRNYQSEAEEEAGQLKTALWAVAQVGTSEIGASYLEERGVFSCIAHLAESSPVYSVRATAFYAMSLMAVSDAAATAAFACGWKCTLCKKPTWNVNEEANVADCEVAMREGREGKVVEKKWATLPQSWSRDQPSSPPVAKHDRSMSESKATEGSGWSYLVSSSSSFPPATKSDSEDMKISNSIGTDSSTSGISSCDSTYGGKSYIHTLVEKPSTLSPIQSANSLSVENGKFNSNISTIPKRAPSLNFGSRLTYHNALAYRSMRMLHRHPAVLSASATMELLCSQDRRQMSPLIRPKLPRCVIQPEIHEFEVLEQDPSEGGTQERSVDSNSRDLEKWRLRGGKYRGICLPLNLSALFSNEKRFIKKENPSELQDVKKETKSRFSGTKRHNRAVCLYCAYKDGAYASRSRKTSSSSVRMRTETESSYGGGVDGEGSSYLGWQPKGLLEMPSDGTGASIADANSLSNSTIALPDECAKSRLILRKQVLKLVEQFANPVLYKTCKQSLLHLKQTCGDLFQDVCLFSDVCAFLANINYRINARQLIQELFLDGIFNELYEDPAQILERVNDVSTYQPESPFKYKKEEGLDVIVEDKAGKEEMANKEETSKGAVMADRAVLTASKSNPSFAINGQQPDRYELTRTSISTPSINGSALNLSRSEKSSSGKSDAPSFAKDFAERHRKLATFQPPDRNLLVNNNEKAKRL